MVFFNLLPVNLIFSVKIEVAVYRLPLLSKVICKKQRVVRSQIWDNVEVVMASRNAPYKIFTHVTNANLQDANLENTRWQNVIFANCKVNGAVFSAAQGLTEEQKQ